MSRAAGCSLGDFLARRVFEPLGMSDTGFSTGHVDRIGSCYAADPETGERRVFDPPGGQWATPPVFHPAVLVWCPPSTISTRSGSCC